ncbi:uncharacterized protein LOC142818258 [Pelodiscus sinensis]|uniref:uncharacterized protein LOC142818258 n=1 Tax=Pelodiscus sinensis TaxID=13735 RepID=UPI003F6CA0D6
MPSIREGKRLSGTHPASSARLCAPSPPGPPPAPAGTPAPARLCAPSPPGPPPAPAGTPAPARGSRLRGPGMGARCRLIYLLLAGRAGGAEFTFELPDSASSSRCGAASALAGLPGTGRPGTGRGSLGSMESACAATHEALSSVADSQTRYRLREAPHWSRAEELNRRVSCWSWSASAKRCCSRAFSQRRGPAAPRGRPRGRGGRAAGGRSRGLPTRLGRGEREGAQQVAGKGP